MSVVVPIGEQPIDSKSGQFVALLPLGVALTIYVMLLCVGLKVLNDGDTYWHIAAGNWILAHRSVPALDPFSGSLSGAPWVAHEWLAEVILAAVYAIAGWQGIIALTAVFAAAVPALLIHYLLRFVHPFYSAVIAAAALLLIGQGVLARPHILAAPILLLWVCELASARHECRSPRMLVLPLMTVWANLHGGFTVGLAIAGVLAIEAVAEAGSDARLRTAGIWLRFTALAVIASLVTPNGLHGLALTASLFAQGGSLDAIDEWHPPDFATFPAIEAWLLLVLFAALYLGIKLPAFRLAVILGFVHLALRHARGAEQLGIIAPILAAPYLPRNAIPLSSPRPRLRLAAAAAVLAAVLPLTLHLAPATKPDGPTAPVSALKAAKAGGLEGRVFSAYPFGGYLLFQGILPFVDSRVDFYGDRFMTAFRAAYYRPADGLAKLLAQYEIGWTIVEAASPAAHFLDDLPGWTRVYADTVAEVHRRSN